MPTDLPETSPLLSFLAISMTSFVTTSVPSSVLTSMTTSTPSPASTRPSTAAHAIIFDNDGTLIDSETLVSAVLSSALGRVGHVISARECLAEFLGMNAGMCATRMREIFPAGLEAALGGDYHRWICTDLFALTKAAARTDLRPIPGIPELLGRLQERGVPMAVASNAEPEWIAATMSITGLGGFFGPHLFSAPKIGRSKPAPDVFLAAAAALGIEPARCIAVEDGIAGTMAAVSAGMRVIGLVASDHLPEGHAGRLTAAGAGRIAYGVDELGVALETLMG